MPITPQDIANKAFEEARRGYNPTQVDEFLEQVSADIDAMLHKIADLKKRLVAEEKKSADLTNELAASKAEIERLKAVAAAAPAAAPVAAAAPKAEEPSKDIYRATEQQLSAALIVAQQTADRIVDEAQTTAERIRNDADAQARKVIRQALDEKQVELDEIDRLKNSREAFRSEYMALLQKFIDAAQANFPSMMQSSMPSGSVVEPQRKATQSVVRSDGNPFGAKIENGFDDLD